MVDSPLELHSTLDKSTFGYSHNTRVIYEVVNLVERHTFGESGN